MSQIVIMQKGNNVDILIHFLSHISYMSDIYLTIASPFFCRKLLGYLKLLAATIYYYTYLYGKSTETHLLIGLFRYQFPP